MQQFLLADDVIGAAEISSGRKLGGTVYIEGNSDYIGKLEIECGNVIWTMKEPYEIVDTGSWIIEDGQPLEPQMLSGGYSSIGDGYASLSMYSSTDDEYVGSICIEYDWKLSGKLLRNDETMISSHADKVDYLVAIASGVLCSMLDVLLVGDFNLSRGREVADKKVQESVVKIAEKLGCKDGDIKESVEFLEKKFPIPSDGNTPDFGGGLQHHLRVFLVYLGQRNFHYLFTMTSEKGVFRRIITEIYQKQSYGFSILKIIPNHNRNPYNPHNQSIFPLQNKNLCRFLYRGLLAGLQGFEP